MKPETTVSEKKAREGRIRTGFLKFMQWIEKGGQAQGPCGR